MHGWLDVQVLSDSKHYLNEVLPISVGSVRAQLLSLLVPFGEIWKILPELLPRRGSLTIWVVVVMWYSETAEPCSHLGEKYRYEIAVSFTMLSVNAINLWQIGGWGIDPSLYFLGQYNLVGLWLNSTTSIKIAPLLLVDTLLQLVFLLEC